MREGRGEEKCLRKSKERGNLRKRGKSEGERRKWEVEKKEKQRQAVSFEETGQSE